MNDLNALADEHLAAARSSPHGRSAHRLLQQPPLRQTVIALTSGSALDEHNAPLAASLLVLRGAVRITAPSGDVELTAGGLGPIPRERHGLVALEDAVVLLTAVND
ncbi:cupin [Streptomyces sp. NBC_00102]|uniref:cupin n=1 Tax=Streptomyces sp. NBC_00102 TaxID=2975652 RepID=UPI00225BBD70|nr:cupin [Streptomyces sp. NBC_00102]MCX5401469.1 cupin [Streptomyces sp. NBC_00102]